MQTLNLLGVISGVLSTSEIVDEAWGMRDLSLLANQQNQCSMFASPGYINVQNNL